MIRSFGKVALVSRPGVSEPLLWLATEAQGREARATS
jgi:hypothetical protein